MKKILYSLFSFFLFSLPIFSQQNVILIIADDLGTDYCGFYDDGLDTANMPNIRSLMDRGVRFNTAWATPICSPTRAGMLTGRYSFRHGVGTVINSNMDAQLDTSEITIGKLLKHNAPLTYATANIGKWHVNSSSAATWNYPSVFGYDHYAGNFLGQLTNYYSWAKIEDGAAPITDTVYSTTENVNDAIKWLGTLNGDKPFFLWLAFNAPHTPYHLPPDSLQTVPGLTGTMQDIMQHRRQYFKAMIEAMDSETGRLFHWLENHNLKDSTTIIFIGDNGEVANVSQFPDTAHTKGTVYENGIHVPMIISGPAVVSPNRASNALVNTHDLFATILELCGFSNWQDYISPNKPVDAVSLMPIIKNQSTSVRDWIFSEIFSITYMDGDGKAIRDTDYKLIRFDNGNEEFYKISSDPQETSNLLAGLPLNAEQETHYLFLCNSMSNLVGTTACIATVGLQDPVNPVEISIIPNPVSDKINIYSSKAIHFVSYQILDMMGRNIMHLESKNTTLEVSTLSSGNYILLLLDDKGNKYEKKFIKI